MRAEKIEELPPAWAKLHRQSASALLRAEAKTLGLLQTALRREVSLVVADIIGLDPLLGDSFLRRRAILTVRRGVQALAHATEDAIRQGRQNARESSYAQLVRELDQVRVELALAGVPEQDQPDDPPKTGESDDPKHEEDDLSAHAAATSLASAWGQRALAKVLKWSDDPSGSLAAQVRKTIPESDRKVRTIATTETARAYSDEHDEGCGSVAEEHEASTWFGAVFRVWSAILDRATCAECAAHDGETALMGMGFDQGDEPGQIHPNCRCSASLVVIPAMIPGHTTPGRYEDDEDEEDAA